MSRTIMRTSFKVKRSKVKVTRPIIAETESVAYLPNGKPYVLQNWYADGAWMRYQLPQPAIKACEVWFLQAGGDIPCRPNPAATNLLQHQSLPPDKLHIVAYLLIVYQIYYAVLCGEDFCLLI